MNLEEKMNHPLSSDGVRRKNKRRKKREKGPFDMHNDSSLIVIVSIFILRKDAKEHVSLLKAKINDNKFEI